MASGNLCIPAHLAGRILNEVGTPADATPELNDEEREVLAALRCGGTNTAIAARLNVSERTVSRRVAAILAKLHLRDRAEAAGQPWGSDRPER